MTPLAIVQFEQLTNTQKVKLLREVFDILEYDGTDQPGAEWSSDTMQALGEAFNRAGAGVFFTDPNQTPNGYRFAPHTRPNGTGCPWSYVTTAEPMSRSHHRGSIRCPGHCAGSVVEVNNEVTFGNFGIINISSVLSALTILGVPHDLIENADGVGWWTLYVGEGDWDHDTQRYTHPIQAPGIQPVPDGPEQGFIAHLADFEYGPTGTEERAEGNGAENIAYALRDLLAKTTTPPADTAAAG
jgi:hypothetical protein